MKTFITPLLAGLCLFALVSCGSDDEVSEEMMDAQDEAAIQEKQNSCEKYFAYMDCYANSIPEEEKPDFMTNYDDMKLKLSERSDDEANQLCTTFLLTLEENKEEAEKTGCSIVQN